MDELLIRHEREHRHLNSKITQKKKQATKKTRKGVDIECNNLVRALTEHHISEITKLNGPVVDEGSSPPHEGQVEEQAVVEGEQEAVDKITRINVPTSTHSTPNQPEEGKLPRRNRQKERLARKAAEREAITAEAVHEAQNQPDRRELERREMGKAFLERGLREENIRPDGHCLYSAFADQIELLGIQLQLSTNSSSDTSEQRPAFRTVRNQAADYISSHPDRFVPFLEESLDDYVYKVRDTAEWGGQLELLALARSYNVDINIIQGSGRIERISGGDDEDIQRKEVWLAYSRHSFGLGEHYNSLRKIARSC